jgi:hypothetical protein
VRQENSTGFDAFLASKYTEREREKERDEGCTTNHSITQISPTFKKNETITCIIRKLIKEEQNKRETVYSLTHLSINM